MNDCLIGYTGFVGSNLDAQGLFAERFNSRNIELIRGKSFNSVYCAGISAEKWIANQKPKDDLIAISNLLDCLREIHARVFVLISTVDVYREPIGVYEDTPIITEGLHAYGLHRRLVEVFVKERFPDHNIIRLPGLFGRNLKKNAIFDLIHNNQLNNIDADSVFQFYNLDSLYSDIAKVRKSGIRTVNFATEPVSIRDVAFKAFDMDFGNKTPSPPARYDMRTRYAKVLTGLNDSVYIRNKGEIFRELKDFVARQRNVTE